MFRTLFGANSSFSFPDFLINTPTKSALLSQYLSEHPQLEQHFKPIYQIDDEKSILVAHDLLPSGVTRILREKKLPIALYEHTLDFELFLKGAVPGKQHVAIIKAGCVSGLENELTHYYAVVYEIINGKKSLYAYDSYRNPTVSDAMQTFLAKHQIQLYYSDTPRSYALKGTSFAYAIYDAEKLRNTHTCYEIIESNEQIPHHQFKLSSLFRYNGLEAKRACFQLLIDTDAQDVASIPTRRGCYD